MPVAVGIAPTALVLQLDGDRREVRQVGVGGRDDRVPDLTFTCIEVGDPAVGVVPLAGGDRYLLGQVLEVNQARASLIVAFTSSVQGLGGQEAMPLARL